jgi:hypothetical protein
VLQIKRNKADEDKTKIVDTISCTLPRYCVLSIFYVFSKNVGQIFYYYLLYH